MQDTLNIVILEQSRIPDFESMDWAARRAAVEQKRNAYLLNLQRTCQSKTYRQVKKNFAHTSPYVHLTLDERRSLARDVARRVSSWGYARLFAECIDKLHFNPILANRTADEQAFEQVVSRFERFLANIEEPGGQRIYGILVHDNNETVARKHTQLMRDFLRTGTLWTAVSRIIETPLFVNSSLTSMVQIADLCAYALRRYLENGEVDLFKIIFSRADRFQNRAVRVRHFTTADCVCEICQAHR